MTQPQITKEIQNSGKTLELEVERLDFSFIWLRIRFLYCTEQWDKQEIIRIYLFPYIFF